MKDVEQLIDRFLAGETSLEEEHQLHQLLQGEDMTDEQNTIRKMLGMSKLEYSTDKWMTEDETYVYDRIIRHRRQRRLFMRWAAAAVFAGIIFIIGIRFGYDHKQENLSPSCKTGTSCVPSKRTTENPLTVSVKEKKGENSTLYPEHRIIKRQMTCSTDIKMESQLIPVESCGSTGNTDSLAFYLSCIERELDGVKDSVCAVHAKQILKIDTRVQRIVNKIISGEINAKDLPMEACFMDY